MDQLKQRRAKVRALRAELAKSVRETRERLSPAVLFEDVLDAIDSKRRFVARAQSGIKRNPLIAAMLLAGAVWLISDSSGRHDSSNRRRQPEKASAPPNHKGDHHASQHHNRDQWAYGSHGAKQTEPRAD